MNRNKVVELVTNCATNPNTNFGDYDFNCKMKTGKCTFKCDGTPSHKYVKCKKSSKGYSWWPTNAGKLIKYYLFITSGRWLNFRWMARLPVNLKHLKSMYKRRSQMHCTLGCDKSLGIFQSDNKNKFGWRLRTSQLQSQR